MWACVVLPLNCLGSANLILFCGQFLLANGAHSGVISGIVVVYIGIEKNSLHGPASWFAIVATFFLSLKKKKKKTQYIQLDTFKRIKIPW